MTAEYDRKLTTAAQAVECVRSGDGIYLHSNAAVPQILVQALVERAAQLRDVRIYKLITFGSAPYADAAHEKSFRVHSMFIGPNIRQAVAEGRADYTPVFFSDLPQLFRSGKLPVDVLMVQVAPPDEHGNMSYGLSLDCTPSVKERAKIIIAEVNKKAPRTHSEYKLHIKDVDFIVEADYAPPEVPSAAPGDVEQAIGKNVASLVEDGATIQLGIGGIPNAVLKELRSKKDLGVHSEMVSDGIIDLIESGTITNSRKTVIPGKIAVSFMFGTRRLYEYVDGNKLFEFFPTDFINDPATIARNYKMTSINSALQIDLTGQVCADSLGTHMYSGCGGQVDFVRGARRSAGGKAIIALPSTADDGTVSRICTMLAPGAGVVTSRADVQYVVTEYGIADLHGLNMHDRVKALIGIAHPDFRSWLREESRQYLEWLGENSLAAL